MDLEMSRTEETNLSCLRKTERNKQIPRAAAAAVEPSRRRQRAQ